MTCQCICLSQISPPFEIPTFTVTINPLESNEMTFVPGSPPAVTIVNEADVEAEPLLDEAQQQQQRIANMTVIVDDEVNNKLLQLNNGQQVLQDPSRSVFACQYFVDSS